MLEQDYLSLQKHAVMASASSLGSQIVREIVIPQLTIEVNENKNFAHLRQVYNSLILATWYKKKIKDSILEQIYANKNKVAGVNINDPQEKEKIYQRYLRAFKKGVYNYIKDDIDPLTQQTVPRKYFSGGVDCAMIGEEEAKVLEIEDSFPGASPLDNDHTVLIESQINTASQSPVPAADLAMSTNAPFDLNDLPEEFKRLALKVADRSAILNNLQELHQMALQKSEELKKDSADTTLYTITIREAQRYLTEFAREFNRVTQTEDRISALLKAHTAATGIYDDFLDLYPSPGATPSNYLTKAKAKLERALNSGLPTLFVRPVDSMNSLEMALRDYQQENPNSIVESITGTPFTDNMQIIGGILPVEGNGEGPQPLKYKQGVLYRLVELAKAHPDKTYILKIDQMEAIPSKVRAQLNEYLLRGELNIPETGEKLTMPSNLKIIASITEGANIGDEAFYERFVRKILDPMSKEDFKEAVKERYGFSDAQAEKIYWADGEKYIVKTVNVSSPELPMYVEKKYWINSMGWEIEVQEGGEKSAIPLPKLLTLAAYIHGRIKDGVAFNDVFDIENGLLFNKYSAGHTLEFKPAEGNLIIDGVALPVAADLKNELATVLNEQSDIQTITQALQKKTGLVLTNDVLKALSAAARALRYGNGMLRLEGPTGAGKTYIAESLSKIMGVTFYGEPIHGASKQSKWLGQFNIDENGNYYLDQDTPFLDVLKHGGVMALSELNTAIKDDYAKLGWWLVPLAMGEKTIYLNEYPGLANEEGGPKHFQRSPRSLVIIDINPDSYQARGQLPPMLDVNVPAIEVSGRLSEAELKEIATDYLKDLPDSKKEYYSKALSNFHYQLQEQLNKPDRSIAKDIDAVITIRQLKYACEMISRHEGHEPDEKNLTDAIFANYVFSFKDPEDQSKINFLIKAGLSGQTIIFSNTTTLMPESSIGVNEPPVVVNPPIGQAETSSQQEIQLTGGDEKELLGVLEGGDKVESVKILLDDHGRKIIVMGNRDNTIKIWKEQADGTFSQTTLKGHTSTVADVQAFQDADGRLTIVSASGDNTIKIWKEGENGSFSVRNLEGHGEGVLSLQAFRGIDGRMTILSGSWDHTIKIWKEQENSSFSVRTLREGLEDDEKDHVPQISVASFQGRLTIISSDDDTTRIWKEQADGSFSLSKLSQGMIRHDMSIDEKGHMTIVSESGDNTIRVSKEQADGTFSVMALKGPEVFSIEMVHDGHGPLTIIGGSWGGNEITILKEQAEGVFTFKTLGGRSDRVESLQTVIDEQGRMIIASGGFDKVVKIWRDEESSPKLNQSISANPQDIVKDMVLHTSIPVMYGTHTHENPLAAIRGLILTEKPDAHIEEVRSSVFTSDFTLFGGYVLDEEAEARGERKFKWADGIIPRIIKQAQADPNRLFVIALDNFHYLPPKLVVALNAILQERTYYSPESKKVIKVPGNVRFVATTAIEAEFQISLAEQNRWLRIFDNSPLETRPETTPVIYTSVDDLNKALPIADPDMRKSEEELLVPIPEMLETESQVVGAMKEGKISILEGDPGGGKTDIAIDIAERFGLNNFVYSAHGRSNISDFIGQYTQDEDGHFVLTARPDAQGNFQIPFLQLLTHGGVFIIDEGAIGKRAQGLIAWLSQIAKGDQVIVLNEHPGVEPVRLERHKDFYIIITTNDIDNTPGRESIPPEVLSVSQRIKVSNDFTENSYREILRRFYKMYGHIEPNEEWIGLQIKLHKAMRDFVNKEDLEDADRHLFTLRDLKNWTRAFLGFYRESGDWKAAFEKFFKLFYLEQFPIEIRERFFKSIDSLMVESGIFQINKVSLPLKYAPLVPFAQENIEEAPSVVAQSAHPLHADSNHVEAIREFTIPERLMPANAVDERAKSLQELQMTLKANITASEGGAFKTLKGKNGLLTMVLTVRGGIKIWRQRADGKFSLQDLDISEDFYSTGRALDVLEDENGLLTIAAADWTENVYVLEEKADGGFGVQEFEGHGEVGINFLKIARNKSNQLTIVTGDNDVEGMQCKIWHQRADKSFDVQDLNEETDGLQILQGKDDLLKIIYTTRNGSEIRILQQKIDGSFDERIVGAYDAFEIRAFVGKNGRLVFVTISNHDDRITIWRENEEGNFDQRILTADELPLGFDVQQDADGLLTIVLGQGNNIKVIHEKTDGGFDTKTLNGHTHTVIAVEAMRDEDGTLKIISASYDGTIKIWRDDSRAYAGQLQNPGPTPILPLAYAIPERVTPQESVFSPSRARRVKPEEEFITLQPEPVSMTSSVAEMTDERREKIHELLESFSESTDPVQDVQMFYDAKGLRTIIAGSYHKISVWKEQADGKFFIRTINNARTNKQFSSMHAIIDEHGHLIIVSGHNHDVKIWREQSDGTFTGGVWKGATPGSSTSSVQASLDAHGRLMVLTGGSGSGIINIMHEQADGRLLIKTFQPRRMNGDFVAVHSAQMICDKQGLLTLGVGYADGMIQIFEEQKNGTFRARLLKGHTDSVNSVQMIRDEHGYLTIVSGGRDSTIKIWKEQARGEFLVKTLRGREDYVMDVKMSLDAQGHLTIISGSRDSTVRIWKEQLDGIFLSRTLEGHPIVTNTIHISHDPEGNLTFISSGNRDTVVRIWRDDEDKVRPAWRAQMRAKAEENEKLNKDLASEDLRPSENAVKQDLENIFNLGFHGLMLLEPGSRDQKIISQLSQDGGFALSHLEANPQMTVMDLMGGLFPVFEGESTVNGKEFKYKPGFLTRHMMFPDDQKRLLVIHNLDALPEKVRAALNNFLLKGYLEIPDDNGKVQRVTLPSNIRILATLSTDSQREFSSAFFNRFVKVYVPALTVQNYGKSELLETLLGPEYGLDERAARQIQNVYLMVKSLESGSYLWPSGTDYHFTVKEALLHAVFLKAAMAEAQLEGKSLDAETMERLVVQEALRVYGTRIQEHTNDLNSFRDIVLKRLYPHELVGELSTAVLEEEGIIKSLGGVPVINTGKNISAQAVDLRYRLTLVPEIVKPLASTIRGWQAGKIVSMVGGTGAAKTTMGVFLAQLMGLDYYIYSTHGESKTRDLTLALQREENGGYSLVVQEFLKRIQAGNQVIILDEANIRPEILWILNGIARGEKEITVEIPGKEPFTVKVGDNVHFLMTMNPESYAGREQIPEVLLENIFKLWVPSDYTPEQLQEILDNFLRFKNQEFIQTTISLLQAQQALDHGLSKISIEQLLQIVEAMGQEGLKAIPMEDLKELEKEILQDPAVKKKMDKIRSTVALTAPDVRLVFTLRGWWAQTMDGKRIIVPLYDLVNPKRSPEAIIGLIIHELRHKRFSPTGDEMKEIAQTLDLKSSILDRQFHPLWNVFEDLRIDHIKDPNLRGEDNYIAAMNNEFFHQSMTDEEKLKYLANAITNPAGVFLNEALTFGYTGHHSEIFDQLPPEVKTAVNQVIEGGTHSFLRQTSFEPQAIPEFNYIQNSPDLKQAQIRIQEEKIRSATESLKVLGEKIFPIYKELALKSQEGQGGGPGLPQFVVMTQEEYDQLINELEEDGQDDPEGTPVTVIITNPRNPPPMDEGIEPSPMSDEDRQAIEEALEAALEAAQQERAAQMQEGERFNLRLSEVSQHGKRLAKGLIELFRVPEEPDIEESGTGMMINPIRYLLKNKEPFDEEGDSLGKPNLALGVTIDVSGSMKDYLLAIKKMSAILMSAMGEIDRKKAEYSISLANEHLDTIKSFKEKYSLNQLNQKQEDIERWMNAGGRTVDEGGPSNRLRGGIGLYNSISGIIEKYKATGMKNKIELLLTDGQDTGGDLTYINGKPVPSQRLKEKLDEAKRLGIEIVGIGFNTRDTEVFGVGHYIQLDKENAESIIDAVLKIARIKVQRGKLPETDLMKLLEPNLRRAAATYQRSQTIDAAEISPVTKGPGGIDFTAKQTPLEIQNAGEGIKFHLDLAMLRELQNAPGFVPVIISIQPMRNIRAFLGLASA